MAKKRKPVKWERKECGCIKTRLPSVGKVLIRCTAHRGKPSKRTLAYFDSDGIEQLEALHLNDPRVTKIVTFFRDEDGRQRYWETEWPVVSNPASEPDA